MEKGGAVGFAASAEKPNGSKSIASLHYELEDAIEPLELHEQARRRLQLAPASTRCSTSGPPASREWVFQAE